MYKQALLTRTSPPESLTRLWFPERRLRWCAGSNSRRRPVPDSLPMETARPKIRNQHGRQTVTAALQAHQSRAAETRHITYNAGFLRIIVWAYRSGFLLPLAHRLVFLARDIRPFSHEPG